MKTVVQTSAEAVSACSAPLREIAGRRRGESGAALIVALWVILILVLLISAMAFEMKVEANVTSYYRKRAKAEQLARAGIAWAEVALSKKVQESADGQLALEDGQDEQMMVAALNLGRGVGVRGIKKELGEGSFSLDILPEEGRRNVNTLLEEDWKELLDQAGVPTDQWDELMDCFYDWIDEGDEHRINGAESDDPFYGDRGYEVKNAALDTVDELMLVKGFSEALVYGGTDPENEEVVLTGIAQLLTTWGDGRVNVNTASREVLLTLPGIDDWVVDAILEKRLGPDGAAGTVDDGFRSVEDAVAQTGLDGSLRDRITATDRKFLRVVSIGEVSEVKSGVWCVLQAEGGRVLPVYWREEAME